MRHGLVTRQLAGRAERVVGVDTSIDMLRQARARTAAANVRYLAGDFRDCRPGGTFDAAVCSSDSLNYVGRPEELAAVFRCVRRNLRPGGLFLFDVVNEVTFLTMSRVRTTVEVGGQKLELYLFYDPEARVSEGRMVFADAVEGHRQVPLDLGDVERAAAEEGVSVGDHFPTALRDFYLVRVP